MAPKNAAKSLEEESFKECFGHYPPTIISSDGKRRSWLEYRKTILPIAEDELFRIAHEAMKPKGPEEESKFYCYGPAFEGSNTGKFITLERLNSGKQNKLHLSYVPKSRTLKVIVAPVDSEVGLFDLTKNCLNMLRMKSLEYAFALVIFGLAPNLPQYLGDNPPPEKLIDPSELKSDSDTTPGEQDGEEVSRFRKQMKYSARFRNKAAVQEAFDYVAHNSGGANKDERGIFLDKGCKNNAFSPSPPPGLKNGISLQNWNDQTFLDYKEAYKKQHKEEQGAIFKGVRLDKEVVYNQDKKVNELIFEDFLFPEILPHGEYDPGNLVSLHGVLALFLCLKLALTSCVFFTATAP